MGFSVAELVGSEAILELSLCKSDQGSVCECIFIGFGLALVDD